MPVCRARRTNSTDCLPSTSYTVGISNARLGGKTDQQHRLSAFHVLHFRARRTNSTDCLPSTSYTVLVIPVYKARGTNSIDCLFSTSYTVGIKNARIEGETDQQHRLSPSHVLHCRYLYCPSRERGGPTAYIVCLPSLSL
ncbi:hypothetical protein RRG08_063114 [Elysia crispata]|uniref:Uncharacterized protein n=1 Tax=Elysia crispata TaxID=231223 RepID=A0AAE1CNF5_9GAST|nr:hypothetical protein RRG08_063114 [Elysia crispata]